MEYISVEFETQKDFDRYNDSDRRKIKVNNVLGNEMRGLIGRRDIEYGMQIFHFFELELLDSQGVFENIPFDEGDTISRNKDGILRLLFNESTQTDNVVYSEKYKNSVLFKAIFV